ncbi:MOSC N-terminal beta barrel domain-containing protein [Massilia phosphatilytica]
MAILTHLLLYPIKSCAGIAVRSAVVNESGLSALGVHDREWMLVAAQTGSSSPRREHPRMALIRPLPDGGMLRIHAPRHG